MRKVSKLFLLISLSFLLTFNSCNNVFENTVSSDDEVQTASAQATKKTPAEESPAAGNTSKSNQPVTIEFGGSLKLKGAVPAEFVEPKEPEPVNQNSRSANAQLPTGSDYEYYVTATSNDGIVKEDVIPVSSVSKDYTLQLEINKTWTFTAGFRKNASGTPGTDSYVAPKDLLIDINTSSGHPYTLTLSETTLQPATQKTFILSPLQTSTGRGTINLNMTAPESGAGITELKLFTSGANGLLQPWQPWAEGESPNLDVSLTQIKTKENMTIASGSYDVTMIFYKHDTSLNKDFQAYISYQTINVFDNMETKVWESGNAPGTESIISGGSFQLTTSLVQKFASSTIYVGAPEGVTVEPDDSRVGSPYAPVKTLNRAFEIIKANTSGDGNTRDYRILVTTAKPTADKAAQPQKANLEIPDTITSTQAKSIEIIGQGSGANLAVLEPAAGNSAGTILTVNTTVPVTLRNIKLAGGKGSGGKGGALSITKNSAKVTIESGTVISGNSASDQGGGIYIQGTDASHKPKLIIKAGAEIKSNSIDNGGTGGMAIFADCAEVEMTGGEISGNNKAGAQYGAVRLTGAAEFTMTGGSVANNDGGAFYVDSDYDAGTSTYIQSKLKIGGSASIPYGVSGTASQQKNDVFVKHAGPDGGGKYSPVYIETSGLNLQTSSKIAITPEGWQRGLEILEAESGTIESYKDYFQLTDGDFNFSKSGSNILFAKLKAPIYIKADGSDSPSASGTKSAPYMTLQHATASLAGGEEDTILIIGSVPAQVVSSALTSDKCSALTIKGTVDEADPSAAPEIDANGANTSALTLSTSVPVTIENLKITGGQGTEESSSSYGGGIYLQTGILKLGDGVQVTGNKAKYGGGVYVKKDTKLFMYGSALIGDSLDTTATGETGCANYSSADGGGIYNAGSIYLGYKGIEEGNPVPETLTGGVKRNASYYGGGGINNKGSSSSEKSNLKINSGYISYNKASCVTDSSESSGSPGGGIQNYQSNIEISGGEISYNEANSGGGVSVTANVSAVFSGGTVKENKAASWGGGITVSDSSNTSFIISGSASVPYGVTESGTLVKAPCKNDVHLASMYGSGDSISSYAVLKVGSNLTASGNVAAITLEHWRRGLQFLGVDGALTALDDTIIGKFDFTDKGWDKKKYTKTTTNDAAKIDADIYVAGSNPAKCKRSDGASAPTDTDNTIGNWAHPFASISAALSSGLLDASHDTIIVDGTVSGAQSISGTGSLSAVAIKGYKAAGATSSSAMINAGGSTGAGSALTVNADGKTVTIQDLTITGGNATDGGGINITKGSVALGTGAKVTGNIASEFGGGVYLSGGDAKLFMYDSSLIGDDATSTTIATDGTSAGPATFANKAVKHGGGIYNNGGVVYIGYSGLSGGNPVKSDMTNGGGVRRNISTTSGYHAGGILNRNGGTVRIASGSISYNFSTTHGGGLYNNNDAGEVLIEEPQNAANKVVFEGNHAKGNGGAIFNRSTLSMSAGQIGGSTNGLQNTVDSGAKGGAIFQDGSFTISGSAVVYAGSETVNDVCLGTAERTIAVGSLSGSGTVASITPASWSRGTNILSATSEISSDVYNRFVLSKDNAGWDRANNNAESTKYVFITSPIYVVDATDSGNTRPTGFNRGVTTDANGTKTSPYASVADAALASDLSEADSKITVAGTLTGAQTISSVASGVSSVTLTGYDSNATINGNAAGSALTINAAKTFTIQQLKITNGRAAAGGGINIESGSGTIVNLDSGAIVYSNKATSGGSGAGVYVASGATLNIKSGSEIYSNAAYSGTINGGGVYNGGTTTTSGGQIYNNSANNGGGVYNGGSLYVTGTSLIGDGTANNNTATGANPGSNCSNLANYGGGIYNNGNLYFGCDSNGSSSTTGYALTASYGVRRNNATQGGGIYLAGGTFKAASGTVSYNHAAYGGAIYVSGGVNNLGAATLASNNVNNSGGALYLANSTSLTVSGAADFNANSVEITSGSNNPRGGAVYNSGTLEVTANATFKNNVAKVTGGTGSAYGGAIYNGGTLTMTAGTIGATSNLNSVSNTVSGSASKAYGGAIYQGGTFNVSGSAKVLPGTERSNDVYLASGKVVNVAGSIGTSGNTTSSQMAITLSAWKRGTQALSFASGVTASNEIGKFKGSETGWKTVVDSSLGKLYTEYKIYVSSSGTASGTGTSSNPYNSIETAVNQCWNSSKDFTIYLDGTLTGFQQTIPAANSTNKTGLAKSITLTGVTGSSSDGIDRNLNSARTTGTALVINTASPVTITKLKIRGGYSSGNGGGILVNGVKGASLTLGEDAVITYNTATTSGGGIYFAGTNESGGTANLIMNSTSHISDNTANGTATTNGGGGVYLSYANLSMSGNALIGDTTERTSASTARSNMAKNGGGVYLASGGKLRLGYASAGATSGTSLTYGIRHNYASACGGGVYAVGSVDFASGAVSYNATAGSSDGDGGGIWFGSASTLTMTGGTIANNYGYYGGGVYAGGTLSMSGGTIGDSSKTTTANNSNGNYSNSASYGGGIYAPNGSTLTLNDGYVSYNYASTSGGGIYSVSSNAVTFKANANFNRAGSNGGGMYIKNQISMTGGVIKGNYAGENGGGVYMDGGNLYMSGSAVIGDSSAGSFATSSARSNYALNNGGGVYLGDESYAYLGYTNSTTPTNSFTGGIYYNYAKYNGGGICDNPDYGNDVKYNGGSISYNGTSSSGSGGAVYLSGNSSTLTFRGSNTKIVAGSYAYYNTVYLDGAIIGVDASNSPTSTTIATIIPSSYSSDTKVMDYTSASSCAAKIKVWPTASDNWLVQNGGYIDKGSRVTSASDAATAIQALSSGKSARIIIECSVSNASTFFSTIKAALLSSSACISLDLTGVTGLTEISNNAFYGGSDGCPSLYSIKLPSTITRIGTNAFANCTNLGKYYNGSLTTSSTQTVYLPESCTEIGGSAFLNCYFNTMDLAHVNTLYTNAFVGWSGTGNQTVTFARESGQTAKLYTGASYSTLAGTYNLSLATSYSDYLGYGDGKWVRQ